MTQITFPSTASLFLELVMPGNAPGQGTGFLVEHKNRTFLITNRHLVCEEGEGWRPEVVGITHNLPVPGTWDERDEPLYDADGLPLWLEHPTLGARVDVVALPLTNTNGIQTYPYDPWNPGPQLAAGVSDSVSIVGFPFGTTGGEMFAVWVRGFIASEPEIDWGGLPQMLIDSRTREGQSGSPVLVYSSGMAATQHGFTLFNGPVRRFIGV